MNLNLARYFEKKFGFSFTFFNDVKSIQNAVEKIDLDKFNLVITLSKGASFRPHYALLNCPELHNKWMAYIHDPYPFHYYPEPYKWSEPGYEKKIEFFENLSEKCSWVSFPSLLLKDWMCDKYPKFLGKEIIMPHQIVETKMGSLQPPYFFDDNKFTLLHAGNLMKQRPPFHLINAFRKFLENVPGARENSVLLLIGNSSYHKEKLKRLAAQIPQLVVKNYLKYNTIVALQKKVSVNIILESEARISPFLPGKFPHCISAEKPILLLAPEKSESKRLLGNNYPYWSQANNEPAIIQIIENLYDRWNKNKGKSVMKREDLQQYLSSLYLKETIEKILV